MAQSKRKIAELASPSPTDHESEDESNDEGSIAQDDNLECIFQVECLQQPPSSPTSSKSPQQQMEDVFIVRPSTIWDSMTRYKNFVINEEQLPLNSTIHVLLSDQPDSHVNTPNSSLNIARVLEIRAFNASNVYLRVFWLYRPTDLPDGEQPYHGMQELVASNVMTILDASTVVGKADVEHWDEESQDSPGKGLFWRQMFDGRTGELSPPKPHCVCTQPLNPSTDTLIRCPHCSIHLHTSCIIGAALANLNERAKSNDAIVVAPATISKKKKGKTKKKKKEVSFEVQIKTGDGDSGRGLTLQCEDLRKGRESIWEEDVICLGCQEIIT